MTEAAVEVIFLGDDGEEAIAMGWVSKRAFRKQLLAHGLDVEAARLSSIWHGYAVATTLGGSEEVGFVVAFRTRPGAFRATWWSS